MTASIAVGTGALTAAPSASARPPSCSEIYRLAANFHAIYIVLRNTGYGETRTAEYYRSTAADYYRAARAAGC
jgi:hypothetical protein